MEIALGISVILFIIFSMIVGIGRALNLIPMLILAGIIFTLFGYVVIVFFPFILIYIIYSIFSKKERPRASKTYYYSNTSGNTAEDFEEFFRRANEGYGNYNYGNSGYQKTSYNNYFEDKSKYYRILGIEEGASEGEIKKAFRTKAKLYHPDKFANESESVRNEQERKFKEINEAYEKLSS